MNRRAFIRDTSAMAVCAASRLTTPRVPTLIPAAPPERRRPTPADVAVFDPSLATGRRLARDARRRAARAFALDADVDIGALWHAQIAPCVARHATLTAALRPADAFVLACFAASRDCRLIDA
ncbi:MAG TPA: hypothetical protein VL689_22095 [Paraburkholderia sp.]|jgi:hypothetical protein|nr:hypothetical protein [Paraburkholderia sp.]